MPRRVSLPAADELFRNTGGPGVQPSAPQNSGAGRSRAAARVPAPGGEPEPTEHATAAEPGADGAERGEQTRREATRTPRQTRSSAGDEGQSARQSGAGSGSGGPAKGNSSRRPRTARRPSGRERHDEKITVYVSAEELMDLEHARLVLRGEYGLAVDRGRIVREAVAVVLADLESRGDASILVRRLRGR